MSILRPARKAPVPTPEPRHQSANPLFAPQLNPLQRYRAIVLGSTAIGLILAGAVWWMFGPWTRLTAVRVSGTVFVTPQSVTNYADYLLDGHVLGVLPRRQSLFFRATDFSRDLRQQIEKRIAVAGVDVVIEQHHIVQITIHERLPVAMWTVNASTGWLDDAGVIVNMGPAPAGVTLLKVVDLAQLPFQVNQPVVDPGVVTALSTLNDALSKSNMTVEEYELPLPTCLQPVVPTPDSVTNANTNVAAIHTNLNATNSSVTNDNVNSAPVGAEVPCDQSQLQKQRAEVDVKLKDGPLVRFDRYTDLGQAVNTLQRLIANNEATGAHTIDLRFQERVYIK